jgi:hypothetical protein
MCRLWQATSLQTPPLPPFVLLMDKRSPASGFSDAFALEHSHVADMQ